MSSMLMKYQNARQIKRTEKSYLQVLIKHFPRLRVICTLIWSQIHNVLFLYAMTFLKIQYHDQ